MEVYPWMPGGFSMGKRNKSKRFVQYGKDTVVKHSERFPYRMTMAEAEAQANSTSGGL